MPSRRNCRWWSTRLPRAVPSKRAAEPARGGRSSPAGGPPWRRGSCARRSAPWRLPGRPRATAGAAARSPLARASPRPATSSPCPPASRPAASRPAAVPLGRTTTARTCCEGARGAGGRAPTRGWRSRACGGAITSRCHRWTALSVSSKLARRPWPPQRLPPLRRLLLGRCCRWARRRPPASPGARCASASCRSARRPRSGRPRSARRRLPSAMPC
mmetsp:Transcript_51377/g.149210  ORF Transcript_51377/g.149210 Transcript_51377/m.149210 type:complete len:216 (+) Transcript_51377:614-1261(+)